MRAGNETRREGRVDPRDDWIFNSSAFFPLGPPADGDNSRWCCFRDRPDPAAIASAGERGEARPEEEREQEPGDSDEHENDSDDLDVDAGHGGIDRPGEDGPHSDEEEADPDTSVIHEASARRERGSSSELDEATVSSPPNTNCAAKSATSPPRIQINKAMNVQPLARAGRLNGESPYMPIMSRLVCLKLAKR